MKRIPLYVSIIVLLAAAASASSVEERVARSRQAVKEFAGKLKGELLAALEEGGPVSAVSVCSEKAPAIAGGISRDKGWEIGRTSLRIRNTENAPDSWERKTLESFEERRKSGEDLTKMEHSEVVTANGKSVFRYMKAIPVGKPCLTCHGKDIVPDLAAKLKELYPEDRATGFSLGEIRGAFTITQPTP